MPYMFEVGKSYETQDGQMVKVLGRSDQYPGYETLICSDDKHRYDRSDGNLDAGRCTGSMHDYSCKHNFKRKVNDIPKDPVREALIAYEKHSAEKCDFEDFKAGHNSALSQVPDGWKQLQHTMEYLIKTWREGKEIFPQGSVAYDANIEAAELITEAAKFYEGRPFPLLAKD